MRLHTHCTVGGGNAPISWLPPAIKTQRKRSGIISSVCEVRKCRVFNKRIMFFVHIVRRLRPCTVSQSFSYVHGRTARHGAFTVSCFRGISGKQLRPVTRSFLNLNNKVFSYVRTNTVVYWMGVYVV